MLDWKKNNLDFQQKKKQKIVKNEFRQTQANQQQIKFFCWGQCVVKNTASYCLKKVHTYLPHLDTLAVQDLKIDGRKNIFSKFQIYFLCQRF